MKLTEKKHSLGINVVLSVILIVSFFLSCRIGQYNISWHEIIDVLVGKINGQPIDESVATVLFTIRIPRVIIAILIGSGLAVAGASFQGIFVNPMVSPDLLGASAGAGFGAAIALLFALRSVQVQMSSFAFGLIAVLVTYSIAKAINKDSINIMTLVLTGLVVSALFQAFITFIKYVADPNDKLPLITFWLIGSLSAVRNKDLLFIIIPYILGIIPLFLLRWSINALSFGDAEAQTLGVNVKRNRTIIILCATLITSSSVAVGGMIGWVGLVIPHLSRMLVGPSYKILLPTTALTGGIFLLWVDNIARGILPSELPLGMLTAIIGAPFFIFLLYRGKKSWA